MNLKARGWLGFEFGGYLAAAAGVVYMGTAAMTSPHAATVRAIKQDKCAGDLSMSQPGSSQTEGDFPDADIGDNDDVRFDFGSNNPRSDRHSPHLSIVDLEAITVGLPGIMPLLRAPRPGLYCLHQNIRERAPPVSQSFI